MHEGVSVGKRDGNEGHRKLMTHAGGVLALLLLASCGGSPGGGDSRAAANYQTEPLPGGGLRVTNTGAPSWTPETAWTLERDLTLGTPDGDGPDVFGLITSFRVAPDGTIYVLDYMSQEVRVFTPAGEFSHSIGRKGSGPGEFTAAGDLHIAPDGRVLVPDLRTARYSLFGRDGTFLASHPRRVRGSAPLGGFTPEGRYIDWGTAFPDEGPDVVAGPTIVFEPTRLSADFAEADSLPPLEFATEMIADGTRPQIFFAGRLMGHQDRAGRVWFVHSRQYQVFRRTLDGDTTLVFTLPARPAAVTDDDREAVRERFSARPQAAAGYLESLSSTKPVVRGLFTDDAGHVYVVPELAGVPAGSVVDVFRDTGEYLGRIELPVAMHVPPSGLLATATRDHLYYLIVDALDVPRLARFSIVRPEDSAVAARHGVAGETRVVLESDGWQLVGDLALPGGNSRGPAVLMLNQADGTRTAYEGLARLLAERGIASLRIDLRAHGESTNLGRFVPGDATMLAGSERDVAAAHAFLRSHARIDGNRIGIVGASYSGESMAQAGRASGYAQAYVALSPGSFSGESLAAIDPSGVPWLFVQSRDERFLQGFELQVAGASATAEMTILPGSGHASDLLALNPDLPGQVAEWLAEHLR